LTHVGFGPWSIARSVCSRPRTRRDKIVRVRLIGSGVLIQEPPKMGAIHHEHQEIGRRHDRRGSGFPIDQAHLAKAITRLKLTASPDRRAHCRCGSGLLGRPVSESGRLCHWDGGHEGDARRRRALMLPILLSTIIFFWTVAKRDSGTYKKCRVCTRHLENVFGLRCTGELWRPSDARWP
jgi:hypothetical protein